ncbi:MAG TPA: hypothetical protein VGQ06_06040 [Gemmatimonadales bacterium]|jgi:hypothetical protein|nr:hypothetical protein [Gemmatimonadales bacterium]
MTILPKVWRANFLVVELGIAIVLTAGFVFWVERCGGEAIVTDVLHGQRSAIYGTLASIFGSLLGFAITAVAIVLGFVPLERMSVVRESVYYDDLWRVFTSAIRVLALATVTTLVGLVLDRDASPALPLVYVCVYATILSLLRLLRCVWILEKVIHLVTRPPRARSGADG